MTTIEKIHDAMQGNLIPENRDTHPVRLLDKFFMDDPSVSDEVFEEARAFYLVNSFQINGLWYV